MTKARSGNPDDKKKNQMLSKTVDFQKIDIEDTFNQNLVNCTMVLTKWEIRADGYRKVKEIFLFENHEKGISFSGDGKLMLLTL